jgi:hypothetical protein
VSAHGDRSACRPNTFVIGAMKSGTSSLHRYLDCHPLVGMSPFKEPAYFLGPVRRSGPAALSDRYRNDLGEYLSLFAGMQDKPIRGESTTDYAKLPRFEGVPERIRGFEPAARIIYLMRDPVERTISHYWWAVQKEHETRDLLTAVREEPFYTDVSDYARQLGAYLSVFPTNQVYVETTERLEAQPEQALRDLWSWLGLDPDIARLEATARINVTPETVTRTRSTLLQGLRHSRAGAVLTRTLPRPLRALGRNLAELTVERSSMATDDARDFLRRALRPRVEMLSDLLGRRFDEWTTFHAA